MLPDPLSVRNKSGLSNVQCSLSSEFRVSVTTCRAMNPFTKVSSSIQQEKEAEKVPQAHQEWGESTVLLVRLVNQGKFKPLMLWWFNKTQTKLVTIQRSNKRVSLGKHMLGLWKSHFTQTCTWFLLKMGGPVCKTTNTKAAKIQGAKCRWGVGGRIAQLVAHSLRTQWPRVQILAFQCNLFLSKN